MYMLKSSYGWCGVMATTRNDLGVYAGFQKETTCEAASCPPAFLEYSWYVLLAYGMLNQAWGIVIPSAGGMLLAVLAAACFLSVGARASRVYAPVALALCTAISMIAVQFFFHSAQALENSIGAIGWLFTVIIVQALSLRPRFLHRFGLGAFAIGVGVLPYINFGTAAGGIRAAASGTGISNPNSLGMWFGFCTLYFIFWGLQTRDLMVRALYWGGALSCLFIVALTVSRGPLLGIALACVVGLRSALKRHFVPVLSLVFLMWMVYESGVFQQTIDSYFARGMEETGRGKVWPLALQRIFDSPWTGVGLDDIPTWASQNKPITPHNGLLYIALGGGILPLMFFLGYLFRAGTGAIQIMRGFHYGEEATLLPPLVMYALMETMVLDTAFMTVWPVVVFALAAVKWTPVRSPLVSHV
jgi:O-antigen ligase